MARIGLKGLTYAVLSTGGAGGAITYASGTSVANRMIGADVSIEREDVSLYADNGRVEHANGVTGGTITLELAAVDDTMREKMLGYVKTDGVLHVSDVEAPYVGFGYITNEVLSGVSHYIGYWFHKVQFGTNSDSSHTKGENTEFQTENLTGSIMGVQLTSGGDTEFYMTKSGDTESAIRTWLNGCAGIS